MIYAWGAALFYPPTPFTTGLPVEEFEDGSNVASADVRPFLEKADEPGVAKRENNLTKTGYCSGTTALAVGLHTATVTGKILCWN